MTNNARTNFRLNTKVYTKRHAEKMILSGDWKVTKKFNDRVWEVLETGLGLRIINLSR